MNISEATFHDLKELAVMFDQYRQFYRQQTNIAGADNFIAERLRIKDSVIYLAKTGDDCAGFVQCYPIFTSVGMKRLWLLNDLFVKKEFRGQGISHLLIDRCKRMAKETHAKGLMLETEKTNDIGNKLYPQEGFTLNEGSNFYLWTVKEDRDRSV